MSLFDSKTKEKLYTFRINIQRLSGGTVTALVPVTAESEQSAFQRVFESVTTTNTGVWTFVDQERDQYIPKPRTNSNAVFIPLSNIATMEAKLLVDTLPVKGGK